MSLYFHPFGKAKSSKPKAESKVHDVFVTSLIVSTPRNHSEPWSHLI